MPFLLIIIAILIALLVMVVVKYRAVKLKEAVLQEKLDEAKMILQNINSYFLLIDRDYIVLNTNYYSLNSLPVAFGVYNVAFRTATGYSGDDELSS